MKNLASEIMKRIRENIQTYTIILALAAIWIFFGVLTDGAYLSAAKFLEFVPPNYSDIVPGYWYGVDHRYWKY